MKTNVFLVIFISMVMFSFSYKNEKKPVLYIIGDSTVKNGRGDGRGGLYGWGQVIRDCFDTSGISVENHAIGGRSSRTFIEEGRWDTILKYTKPGDYVLIQFGHNDGGPLNTGRARGTLKGTGDETETVIMEADSSERIIHTYGHYIKQYVKDAKDKGAIPIVLSYIPRNIWEDGKVRRGDYTAWAEEAALSEGAIFVNLHELAAQYYEKLGEDIVSLLFFTQKDHTHTSLAGAQLNAHILTKAIGELENCGLKDYLKK